MDKTTLPPMKRTLWRNSLYVFIFFLLITLAIAVFTYSTTQNALEAELMKNNTEIAASYAEQMDAFFINIRRLNATLSVNQLINSYIASPKLSPSIFEGLYESIRSQLETAIYPTNYIESIYIVSPSDNSYISKDGYLSMNKLMDMGWLEALPENAENGVPVVQIRKMNGIYPYVISYVTPISSGKNVGYIVININIKRLPSLAEDFREEVLSNYIITEEGTLLYRPMKRDLLETRDVVPALMPFQAGLGQTTQLVKTESPYIYSQVYSPANCLYYVTVTRVNHYTQSLSMQRRMLASFSCLLLLLFAVITLFLSLRAQKPIRTLLSLISHPQNIAYQTNYTSAEVKQIAEHFVRYVQANTELSTEIQNQMRIMNDVRLWALQSQINPHFIFNTLNLIHCEYNRLCGYGNPASDLMLKFSKIIRYALYSNHLVPLNQEMAYTALFIDILNKRYGDSIYIDMNLPENCQYAAVPKLLLQPLIENATQHGSDFSNNRALHIHICAEKRTEPAHGKAAPNSTLYFTVQDDGLGIPPDELKALKQRLSTEQMQGKRGIGLGNVSARLSLLYPGQASLEIESRELEGTCVTIAIPFMLLDDHDAEDMDEPDR